VCQTVYEDIYDVKPKVKIQISVQDYNYGNFEDQEKEIVESDNKDEEQGLKMIFWDGQQRIFIVFWKNI